MRPTICPGSMSKDTLSSATIPPNRTGTSRATLGGVGKDLQGVGGRSGPAQTLEVALEALAGVVVVHARRHPHVVERRDRHGAHLGADLEESDARDVRGGEHARNADV